MLDVQLRWRPIRFCLRQTQGGWPHNQTLVHLRHFALRYIQSHSNATGVFRNVLREIVALTPSGNHVRHIITSQDDAVAGLLGR